MIFVTVGSTSFDQLIEQIDQQRIYETFEAQGYKKIVFSIGLQGKYQVKNNKSFEIEQFNFTDDFQEYFQKADLIITHAGAGSILEGFKCNKKMIVVINQNLQDNHQLQLFEKLFKEGYIQGMKNLENFGQQLSFHLSELQYIKPYSKSNESVLDQMLKDDFQ